MLCAIKICFAHLAAIYYSFYKAGCRRKPLGSAAVAQAQQTRLFIDNLLKTITDYICPTPNDDAALRSIPRWLSREAYRKQGWSERIRYICLALCTLLCLSFYSTSPVMAQEQPGITSPSAGSSVSGAVTIMGTAVIEPFQRYEIYVKQEPNGDDAYIYVTGGTQPVVNGQLGVIDATAFAPGSYTIRLRVVKLDGNYAEFFAPNLSFNQNDVPTPTPTPTPTAGEPIPTPIPTQTFTPAPQPTPIVGQVTQPIIETDSLPNTPTPAPVAAADTGTQPDSNAADSQDTVNSGSGASNGAANEGAQSITLPSNESDTASENSGGITSQLGEAVGLDKLRNQFFVGMRYSALAFLLVGILFLFKSILQWMRSQI